MQLNDIQKEFLLKLLLAWLILIDAFAFWYAFIHQYIGLWTKPFLLSLAASMWSFILLVISTPITVLVWIFVSHPEILFKKSRKKPKKKTDKKPKKKEEKAVEKSRLRLF